MSARTQLIQMADPQRGHTAEINRGSFHPTEGQLFLTCSNDSTLRIWDIGNRQKQKAVIVVKSKERGARTRVTSCAWSPDGNSIAGSESSHSLDREWLIWQLVSMARYISGRRIRTWLDPTGVVRLLIPRIPRRPVLHGLPTARGWSLEEATIL